MFKSVTGIFRKLLPGAVLLTLAYLAGGTDVFSSTVREHFSKALSEYGTSLGPFFANFLAGALFFWVCWVAHPFLKGWY